MTALKWKVGDTTITKLEEITYPEFSDVIPAATPEVVKQIQWLFPWNSVAGLHRFGPQ